MPPELTTRFQLAFARAYAGQEEQALDECRTAIALSDRHGEGGPAATPTG